MPRIRTLKPEFWTDEKLAGCDALTRLVFLGLISQADDDGRLVDSVKLIDGALFPATSDSCERPLEVLEGLGRILRYTSSSGQRIIQIKNWKRHQKVDHPNRYTLPGPRPQDWKSQPVTETLANGSRNSRESGANGSRDPRDTTNDQRPTTIDLTTLAGEPAAAFDAFWEAFPKRAGSNPKKEARGRWNALLKKGTTPESMIAAAERYAKFCAASGKLGTEYVMRATTFLGDVAHIENEWTVGASSNGRSSAQEAEDDAELAKMQAELR